MDAKQLLDHAEYLHMPAFQSFSMLGIKKYGGSGRGDDLSSRRTLNLGALARSMHEPRRIFDPPFVQKRWGHHSTAFHVSNNMCNSIQFTLSSNSVHSER
eukprot:scaffold287489_cov19-Tisochrysis_lutea.AAC.2